MPQTRFAEILSRLAASEVDFIVVGMTAGILQGAPLATFDLAIVLGDEMGYDELLPRTVVMDVSGLKIRVLSLPALIEAKQRAGRPKDLAALPVLRATLDELKRR